MKGDMIMSTKNNKKNIAKATKKGMTLAQSIVADGIIQMNVYGYDWFQAMVPIDLIETEVPYQRPLNAQRVKDIVKKFDNAKVGDKLVNYRPDEDKFYLMDGRHTITALKAIGKTHLPCHVFVDETYEREAQIFGQQYDGVVKVNTADRFKADVEAKEDTAMIIQRVLDEFHIERAQNLGVGRIRSIQKPKRIVKEYGEAGLRFTFQLIKDAGWANDGKAYSEAGLNVGYYSYPQCLKKNGKLNKTKYNCLVKILRGYKTSTGYTDTANVMFGETTTKHPEYLVKKLIQVDLELAQAQAEKMLAYQRKYYRQYVKVQ